MDENRLRLAKCPHCGSYFKTTDPEQIFCSALCLRNRKRFLQNAVTQAKAAAAWFKEQKKRKDKGLHYCYCLYCLRRFDSRDPDTLFCSDACEKIFGGNTIWKNRP